MANTVSNIFGKLKTKFSGMPFTLNVSSMVGDVLALTSGQMILLVTLPVVALKLWFASIVAEAPLTAVPFSSTTLTVTLCASVPVLLNFRLMSDTANIGCKAIMDSAKIVSRSFFIKYSFYVVKIVKSFVLDYKLFQKNS